MPCYVSFKSTDGFKDDCWVWSVGSNWKCAALSERFHITPFCQTSDAAVVLCHPQVIPQRRQIGVSDSRPQSSLVHSSVYFTYVSASVGTIWTDEFSCCPETSRCRDVLFQCTSDVHRGPDSNITHRHTCHWRYMSTSTWTVHYDKSVTANESKTLHNISHVCYCCLHHHQAHATTTAVVHWWCFAITSAHLTWLTSTSVHHGDVMPEGLGPTPREQHISLDGKELRSSHV